MAYSDKVIDHYNNPRNVGQLDKSQSEVGTGLVGAPECGDVMRLQIRVNPETQVIEEAKFKTFGCGSAIASSSLATEWVKGKTVEEAVEKALTQLGVDRDEVEFAGRRGIAEPVPGLRFPSRHEPDLTAMSHWVIAFDTLMTQ